MKENIEVSLINSFLIVYFYLIEKALNEDDSDLLNIKFQSEEANTDEYLKKFFKQYFLDCNNIPNSTIKSLSVNIDDEIKEIAIEKLSSFSIDKVYLPEELSEKIKKEIRDKKPSVYTNPDLYLEISDDTTIYYESVELKSTKTNKIPGSSVQQVTPFEWVVFLKRNKQSVNISIGYYINSITEKLPFPDRSPRPEIGFKTLVKWNEKFRNFEDNVLSIKIDSAQNKDKLRLLTDWQDYLTEEWMSVIKSSQAKKNEKWFNNALRKFAVKFLDYSENMTASERKELRTKLDKIGSDNL